MVRSIALIVASVSLVPVVALKANEPPPGFLRKVAERELENAHARENYTYRQSIAVQEFNIQGAVTGEYHLTQDITFGPNMRRFEQVVDPPRSTLTRVRLTQEDFADIRNVEPFLLTPDKVFLYEGRYQGEETMDGRQDVLRRQAFCFRDRLCWPGVFISCGGTLESRPITGSFTDSRA